MGKQLKLQIIVCLLSIMIQLHLSYASNCTQLPKAITPEKCCRFPRLLKQNAFDHCASSVNSGKQCLYECIYAATEFCRKRECDVRKTDDYVDWVKLEITEFNDVYKQAYRECINEVTQLKDERFRTDICDPQPELIDNCVHNKMFTLCPVKYYNSDLPACAQKREFLNNCSKIN